MILTTTIDGLDTKGPNGSNRGSMGAMYADRKRIANIRKTVELRVRALVGRRTIVGIPRVTITRLSSAAKPMDRDNRGLAIKPVFDGIADALGLDDDHELQECAVHVNERCERGHKAIRIEIEVEG